ncbi:hypothetical protein [Streptococcus sobrinus]|uniref:hypothetical protein n=1 Tax=Streptococcus sobrinus TaxID=1310 RepID=UPI00036309EC
MENQLAVKCDKKINRIADRQTASSIDQELVGNFGATTASVPAGKPLGKIFKIGTIRRIPQL